MKTDKRNHCMTRDVPALVPQPPWRRPNARPEARSGEDQSGANLSRPASRCSLSIRKPNEVHACKVVEKLCALETTAIHRRLISVSEQWVTEQPKFGNKPCFVRPGIFRSGPISPHMPQFKNISRDSRLDCHCNDLHTTLVEKWTKSGWSKHSLTRSEVPKLELSIAAINVAKTANNQTLANGNQIADLGTYVKTDVSTGGLGETHGLADVNLAADTFHRQFTTSIPPTPATAALPDMQGSGAVQIRFFAANDCVLEIRIAA